MTNKPFRRGRVPTRPIHKNCVAIFVWTRHAVSLRQRCYNSNAKLLFNRQKILPKAGLTASGSDDTEILNYSSSRPHSNGLSCFSHSSDLRGKNESVGNSILLKTSHGSSVLTQHSLRGTQKSYDGIII